MAQVISSQEMLKIVLNATVGAGLPLSESEKVRGFVDEFISDLYQARVLCAMAQMLFCARYVLEKTDRGSFVAREATSDEQEQLKAVYGSIMLDEALEAGVEYMDEEDQEQ